MFGKILPPKGALPVPAMPLPVRSDEASLSLLDDDGPVPLRAPAKWAVPDQGMLKARQRATKALGDLQALFNGIQTQVVNLGRQLVALEGSEAVAASVGLRVESARAFLAALQGACEDAVVREEEGGE